MSWTQLAITVVLATVAFIILSRTEFGLVLNTVVFAVWLTGVLIAAKLAPMPDPAKESFFFEAAPYRKCHYKGFYGRPLAFDYQLPECPEQCNPY